MRSEQEMLNLILDTAKNDERIRAVIQNGSRVNASVPRDIFQDFDIVYIVTDVAPFKYNFEWIGRFGDRMIMQMPEDIQDPPPGENGSFTYLMQFLDGNRIDLNIFPIHQAAELTKDSLKLLLLDKDAIFGDFGLPNERSYLPHPPTSKQFSDCCNEFWWVCPYAAKGLWRREITYVKHMQDVIIREQLMKMLTWYIGVKTQFSKNPGKLGKYFEGILEPELWEMLVRTYSNADYANIREALVIMGDLFRIAGACVAEAFGFEYPQSDDERVSRHLKHVLSLPRSAASIY